MIKWKEKGWKATGLHHGVTVFGAIVAVDLFGSAVVATVICFWYIWKEIREALARAKGLYGVEWPDFAAPILVSLLYFAYIRDMISWSKILTFFT